MAQLIKGIHHVNIRIPKPQLDKAIDFYTQALGLEKYRFWKGRNGDNYMLKVGEDIIEIMESDTKGDKGVIEHFALSSDDVDNVIEKVIQAGLQVDRYPKDVVLDSDPPMPIRIAFFYGFGNEYIEVFKEY